MTLNKKKNILLLVATVFLLLALFDGWQYGFFTLLRFVVCVVTAYMAWLAYENKKEWWVWIFGFVVVLFNPLVPIHLDRETWWIIDLITGLFLLSSVRVFKLDK